MNSNLIDRALVMRVNLGDKLKDVKEVLDHFSKTKQRPVLIVRNLCELFDLSFHDAAATWYAYQIYEL